MFNVVAVKAPTETELLACRLYNEYAFTINDTIIKARLQEKVKEYYIKKADNEVLDCYNYDAETDKISAYDFIVSLQNLCHSDYLFIEQTNVQGLSLFFKLYKVLYGSFVNTFTTENVNNFIENVIESCEIFKEIVNSIFTDKISTKLFNNTCQKKIDTLKKNNMLLLLSSIIGFINKGIEENIIKNSIEKCLLYHFMISDIKTKDKREDFKNYDSITYRAGGGFIENSAKNLLKNPEDICIKLTEKLFNDLFEHLYSENINPHERFNDVQMKKKKKDKRRQLLFYEKTLMFYYYKQNVPTNILDSTFWIEHMIPNSSEWDGEIDKDRPGNLVPIIESINRSRGNRHIKHYTEHDYKNFMKSIKDIIPTNDEYDEFVKHTPRKATVINNEKYNNFCEKNEKLYVKNIIDCLFCVANKSI